VNERTPRGLHGQVVQEVGRMIAAGEILADAQIVPEDLGGRFGVSRTVVREALRVLESKGMLLARPRTGTRVLPVGQWDLLDEDVILWRVSGPGRDSQLRDLVELRCAVEPIAARSCCTSADEDAIGLLVRCCDQMEAAVTAGDNSAFTAADIRFHATLLAASGNRIFKQISGAVEAVLHARETLQLMPDHVDSEAVAAHRQIAEAIMAGDEMLAEGAARHLIEVAGQEIYDRLDRRPWSDRRSTSPGRNSIP
jgi:DNA-binding FadR family transcriptional regulator